MSGKLKWPDSIHQENCHLQTAGEVVLTPVSTLLGLYLPNEGVCPTFNPVHLPMVIQKASSCLPAAPDPFPSKFTERRNKKLSRSCWQSAVTKVPPPIPAPPEQHPSPKLSRPMSQPRNLPGGTSFNSFTGDGKSQGK